MGNVTRLCLAGLMLLASSAIALADAESPDAQGGEAKPITREFGSSDSSPRVTLHGFADVTANAYRDDFEDGTDASRYYFALGELDLFVVSHLSDNISFLGEIVFETNTDRESQVELERMFIKYSISDWFWISVGRHHTALGYWNEAFHHGLLLQPTVERPDALKWEEQGGTLPVHSVGLAMGGRVFHGPWWFEYAANIGNGRGPTSRDVETSFDLNNQKAFTLRLSACRETTWRVLFGPMIHIDRIPTNPLLPFDSEETERIVGAFVTYRNDHFELISEYYYIRHESVPTGEVFDSPAYFAIGVWNLGKLKPYAGYDRNNVDSADPFYGPLITPLKRGLVGLRWDVNSFNAIKFELRHDIRPGVVSNGLVIQTAFTF